MGFRRPNKVYKLVFTGENEGLEVKARAIPLGEYMAIAKMLDVDTSNAKAEDIENLDAMFHTFSKALVSWNLEDEDGRPVPTNVDGLYSQDLEFVLTVIVEWVNAVTGVSSPLEQTSNNGNRSLEESLQMEPLS